MREEFVALVFGPNLATGGAKGSLVVTASGIEVSVSSAADAAMQTRSARFNELALREVGFGPPGVELAWSESDGPWVVHVLDNLAARRLLALPGFEKAQASALQSKRRRSIVARTLGWSLIGLFVLLPVILLALLFLNSNRFAGWIADKVPMEQEITMGRQAFAGMRGNLKLKDQGAAYDAVLSIVDQLTQGSKYRYEVHVSDDQTLNAFAMPGGIVVVNTGLIAATKRPEELAGVLAHEVQHVELRHSIRGMVKGLGLRGLWAFATGDLGGTLVGEAALQLTSLKFSRDDETDADYKGFAALVDAGIDPAGMPEFFKTMSEKAADSPVSFISTHPLSENRERALQQKVDKIDRTAFKALTFPSWPPTE